jgi:hypothetical protein
MPPTPQPTTPTALIIVVCESVPTSVSGKHRLPPARFLPANAGEQMFEVDLVHDAHAGRHDAEGVESLHAPLHELIALVVALELPAHVLLQRLRRAVVVNLHRMIDDQIDRHQRLDAARIVPRWPAPAWRIAARSQSSGTPVKSCSTTRATTKGISSLRSARGCHCASSTDMPLGDPMAIAVAQQRFQHDAQRHRQAGDVADLGRCQRRQRVEQRLRLSRAG